MGDINIAALVAAWMAKYTDNGQSFKDIRTQLFQPTVSEQFFRLRPNGSSTTFKSVYATVDSVLQAFTYQFAPKGGATFKPWEIELGEFKIDDILYPDKLKHSWAGFVHDPENKDRSKWGIVEWYIRASLLPKAIEEYENETFFWGWKKTGFDATPTVDGSTFERELADANAPLPANAAVDGIRTQIIKMVDSGRVAPVASGAIEAAPKDFCNQIEDFVSGVDRLVQNKLDYLFMSEELAERYVDGRVEKYNMNYQQVEKIDRVKRTNIQVVGLPSMKGSEKIWATPKENRVLVRKSNQTGRFNVQVADRGVKFLNDWDKIATFEVPELVVTNDLENAITAGDIAARY